ncbi:MAG: PAS domain S-box protein [Desulfobacterales bacterium]|nr:PAS domain S-box protein [Desulfobacterales bacterium]
MRLRALQAFFVLALIAGMELAAISQAQAASGILPEPHVKTADHPTPAADLSQKNVLILHGVESNAPIFELTDRGIRGVLETGGIGIRNQFFEYLDLMRNPGPEHRILMTQLMRQRYAQRRIDLVITLYPEALLFAVNEGCTIFPGSPIVALYLPEGFELPHLSCPATRQIVVPDIDGTIGLALKLVRGAKLVFVVSGTHPLDRWVEHKVRLNSKKWEPVVEFRFLNDVPLDGILETLSDAPAGSIVLFTVFQEDVTGAIFTAREVGEKLSRASRAPVFGLLDPMLGHGIVGGSLISFEYIGTKAAQLALDILNGVQPADTIPAVLDIPHLSMFDWRQLRRWNLSENDLPAGSIVINREPTFWDFKYYILGGLVFLVGQSFLIFVLLAQRNRRRAAEGDLRRKKEELDKFFSMNLDLLCIADTEGYFLRLNPAWENTLGFGLAELLSKPFLELVHPEDVAATRKAMRALSDGGQILDFTNRYRRKDGIYRQIMWSAAAAGDLIYAAARDITEHIEAESTIRERERELQSLTGRMILGQEAERRRLARELHDDLSQRLAALAIEIGKLEPRIEDRKESILQHLRSLRDQTIRIAADVHHLSRRLHPSILEDLGLTKAVEAECNRFSIQEGIEVTFNDDNIPEVLPKDVSLSIYRIIQESLNNIAKHACARRAAVCLNASDSAIQLSIRDDGIGFDPAEVRKKPGLGLSSIRERVRIVNGKHRITSEPEKGTIIDVTVPLKPEAPQEEPGVLSEGLS